MHCLLHIRDCPSACSKLCFQMEATHKVCGTTGLCATLACSVFVHQPAVIFLTLKLVFSQFSCFQQTQLSLPSLFQPTYQPISIQYKITSFSSSNVPSRYWWTVWEGSGEKPLALSNTNMYRNRHICRTINPALRNWTCTQNVCLYHLRLLQCGCSWKFVALLRKGKKKIK